MIKSTFILAILLIFNVLSCNNKESDKQTEAYNDSTGFFQKDIKDLKMEIKEANKKYKIKDSKALNLLKNIRQIQDILNTKYSESEISNELIIEAVPFDADPNWSISLRQSQPKINHTTALLFFMVDANSGQIKVMDNFLKPGEVLNLDDWILLKEKKQ